MPNPVAGIDIIARTKAFEASLAKLPGMADKEGKAFVRQLSRQFKAAELAAEKEARASGDAWKKELGGVGKAAKAAGFGGVTEQLRDVSEAFQDLTGVSEGSTVALGVGAGGVAAAVLAVDLAMAAWVGTLAYVGAGLVETAFSAKEAQGQLAGLAELGASWVPVVTDEQQWAIDRLAVSRTALDEIWAAVTVTAGANVAPAVERVAEVSLGAMLAGEAWFAEWARGKDLLDQFARVSVGSVIQVVGAPLVGALEMALSPLGLFLAGLESLADVAGVEVPASVRHTRESIESAMGSISAAPYELTQSLVDLGEGMAEDWYASAGLADSFDDLGDAGRALLNQTVYLSNATEEHTKAVKDDEKAMRAALDAADKMADAFIAEIDAQQAALAKADALVAQSGAFRLSEDERILQKRDENLQAYLDLARAAGKSDEQIAEDTVQIALNAQDEITAADAKAAAERARVQEEAARRAEEVWKGQVNEVGGYITQGLSMLSSALDEGAQHSADTAQALEDRLATSGAALTEEQRAELAKRIAATREMAMREWEIAKAAKLAQAFASTQLAVINAIAESPPPSPLGLIGAGIAEAAGVASMGAIASEQLTFHAGGLAPDEFHSTMRLHEAALSPMARDLLGDDRINDLNGGRAAAPTHIVVEQRYGHRAFDRFMVDVLHRSSPLTSALGGAATVPSSIRVR